VPGGAPGRADDVAAAILTFVNTDIMAEGRALRADEAFEPAGVDSMALLRIFLFVETEYGFWIPDEDLVPDNVGSVAALARYVARKVAA
jgi:acyl carrier protein